MLIDLKKIVLTILYIVLYTTTHHTIQAAHYASSVVVPPCLVNLNPFFTFFYQGDYFQSKAALEFYTSPDQKEFYIVIAQDLELPKMIHIDQWRTKCHTRYRWWRLVYCAVEKSESSSMASWSVQELDNSQSEQILPTNSIIFLWNDPDDIVYIKPDKHNYNVRYNVLPTVFFKSDISEESFKEKLNYMNNVCVNFRIFHAHDKLVSIVNQQSSTQITMPSSIHKYIHA